MASICPIEQVGDDDCSRFGAKARGLSRLAAAGLAVPPGIGIASEATDEEIVGAYQRLGGTVAVRSSAAVEDGASASFAGQFQTVLNVTGESAVLDAVRRVRASGQSARAAAYRQATVAAPGPSIAVIVQRQIRADLAGVLLTRDPGNDGMMLIEAGRGTAAVTAGRDNPGQVCLDRRTGAVDSGAGILSPAQAQAVGELGRRVEQIFGQAIVVEWAIEGDRLWVLQARPATDVAQSELDALRAAEIERLRALAGTDGTAWEKDEFCAALEQATSMTWALLEQMFAADGGLGAMYADFGCAIDPKLGRLSLYDLVAGRPRLNRSRARRMEFGDLPIDMSGSRPTSTISPGRWLFRLPGILWRLRRRQRRIAELMHSFPEQFRHEILPAFERRCDAESAEDAAQLSDAALLERFATWSRMVLVEFARDALKPAALAAWIVDEWRRTVGESEAQRRAATALAQLRFDRHCDLAGALRALAAGVITLPDFLRDFGHRAAREWELAEERYSERPPIVRADVLAESTHCEAQPEAASALSPEVAKLRRLVQLRESAKNLWLKGWARLRVLLLEMDRRWGLHGGIFYLLPVELSRAAGGEDFAATIADRRRRRRIERALFVPATLRSDDLEQLGRPPEPPAGEPLLRGLPISPGTAHAPARVLTDPSAAPLETPYVLVCPAAEPAWTPHLLRARAAVFEVGGALAHCAIVAREFGVPAVSGIADATRRIPNGRIVTVDGRTGTVQIGNDVADERR